MKLININMNFGDINYYSKKEHEFLAQKIINNKNKLNSYCEVDNFFVGYKINNNEHLSKLYGFPIKIVDFYSANVKSIVKEKEFIKLQQLVESLFNFMAQTKAYYTLRVPTNFGDLLRAFNMYSFKPLVCGGTVMFSSNYKEPLAEEYSLPPAFIADDNYVEKNKNILERIIKTSFNNYQSQYHISPILREKASSIYQDWISRSFTNQNEKIIVSEYNNTPVGIHSIAIRNNHIEGVLGAVDPNYRNKGVYKSIIQKAIIFSSNKAKDFVIGTQLDNFIVQNQWARSGMKPFFSFYSLHCDFR